MNSGGGSMTKLFTKRQIKERAMVIARHTITGAIIEHGRSPRDIEGAEMNRMAKLLIKKRPEMLAEAERQLRIGQAIGSKT